jgi:pimeloyl-ACP methyl ester carboxylesterase
VDDWVTSGDGTKLAMRRYGSGTQLVLVHPSSGGLDSFAPIVPLLEGFELWAYARRGYAPSGSCERPKTFADDVADLQAVLDAAGGQADVLGASYGAAVALHTAHADSSGIQSLVLFEPPLFAAGSSLAGVLERYRSCLDEDALACATRLFAAEVARVPAPLLDAPASSRDEATADRAEAAGCLHDLEAMAADTLDMERWANVTTPTLLMQGSETWQPMPATIDALAGSLPAARRAVLAGQAHFATHTAPALFARTVADFLGGV